MTGCLRMLGAAVLLAGVGSATAAGPRPTRAEIDRYRPLMDEVQRVTGCANRELQRRGMDIDDAFAALDRLSDAPARRAAVLRLIERDLAVPAGERARLARGRGLQEPLLTYVTLGSAMPDPAVASRAAGLLAVHLDRAVGGVCKPSSSLITHTGAPHRAD